MLKNKPMNYLINESMNNKNSTNSNKPKNTLLSTNKYDNKSSIVDKSKNNYDPKFIFKLDKLEIDFSNQDFILRFFKTKQNQWIFKENYKLFDIKYKLYFSDNQTQYVIESYFRFVNDTNFNKLSLIPNAVFYKIIAGLLGVKKNKITYPSFQKLNNLNIQGKKAYIVPLKKNLSSFQLEKSFQIYNKKYLEIGAISDFVILKN